MGGYRLSSFSIFPIFVHLVFVGGPTSIRLALRCYSYAYVKRKTELQSRIGNGTAPIR